MIFSQALLVAFTVVASPKKCEVAWYEAFVRFERRHGHRLAKLLKKQHVKMRTREVHIFDGTTDKYIHSYVCIKGRDPIIVDERVTRRKRHKMN